MSSAAVVIGALKVKLLFHPTTDMPDDEVIILLWFFDFWKLPPNTTLEITSKYYNCFLTMDNTEIIFPV